MVFLTIEAPWVALGYFSLFGQVVASLTHSMFLYMRYKSEEKKKGRVGEWHLEGEGRAWGM